ANGRLHFHAVHFMRTLPTGSVDPNFGRRVRNRRQLNSLQNTWPYGYSMPIAVRYTQDAFSRSGWLWPVDAKGEPLKATSYMAVGFYVAKYVNNLGNLLLLGKIGVFHNRRNASSRLLLLISKHLILCIYLVFRILACSRRLNASNLFLSLILHLGNLFLIVQLHFSKLFLIVNSGVSRCRSG